MARPNLLIVDDESDMLSMLKRTVAAEHDWEILTASSGTQALDVLSQAAVDLVLLDIKMPDVDGMELLDRIKDGDPTIVVVMMTAYGVIDLAVEAIRKGAHDFLTKPFDATRLLLTLKKAMEYRRLARENRALQRLVREQTAFQDMVGANARMREIFETIQTVAKTDATVLVIGESGTGKELVCRAIHELSPRRDAPFVAVNCPTLPESVLETELFGYAKGAFTDAKADKRGLFQEAHGGTVFLDEIAELPMSLQAKLLRVLQEREIKPLGHPRSIRVDVRVVASTNRDLRKRIIDGQFREDLFYRLNVISIALPPLRERMDDVPILAEHFLRSYTRELGRTGLRLSAATLDRLLQSPWPGNVRELENTMKRAAIMARGDAVGPEDLALEAGDKPSLMSHLYHLQYRQAKEQVLAHFNEEFLMNALATHGGNVTQAARRLGLERQALQQLLRKYGVDATRYRKAGPHPGEDPVHGADPLKGQ